MEPRAGEQAQDRACSLVFAIDGRDSIRVIESSGILSNDPKQAMVL
jgi:hypothetical protein